jgi:hypothetical protein
MSPFTHIPNGDVLVTWEKKNNQMKEKQEINENKKIKTTGNL